MDDLESYSHVDRVVMFIWQSDPTKLRQDIQESKAESRGPGGRFARAIILVVRLCAEAKARADGGRLNWQIGQ